MSKASSITSETTHSTTSTTPHSDIICNPVELHDSFLICPLCLKQYTKPKLLNCLHTFCQDCLHGYVLKQGSSLNCPVCNMSIYLPVEGVCGLSNNPLVEVLLWKLHRKSDSKDVSIDENSTENSNKGTFQNEDHVNHPHNKNSNESNNNNNLTNSSSTKTQTTTKNPSYHQNYLTITLNCFQHTDQLLNQYCTSCEALFCPQCIHPCPLQLVKVFNKNNEKSLVLSMGKLQNHLRHLDTSIKNINKTRVKLQKKEQEAEEELSKNFKALFEALEKRRETLMQELKVKSANKHQILKLQEAELVKLKNTFAVCRDVVYQKLKCDFNDSENLLTAKSGPDDDDDVFYLLANQHLRGHFEAGRLSSFKFHPNQNPFVAFDGSSISKLIECMNLSTKTNYPIRTEQSNNTTTNNNNANSVINVESINNKISSISNNLSSSMSPSHSKKLSVNFDPSIKNGENHDDNGVSVDNDDGVVLRMSDHIGGVLTSEAVPHKTEVENIKNCYLNTPTKIVAHLRNHLNQPALTDGVKLTAKIFTLTSFKSRSRESSTSKCASVSDKMSIDSNDNNSNVDDTELVKNFEFSNEFDSSASENLTSATLDEMSGSGILVSKNLNNQSDNLIKKKVILLPKIIKNKNNFEIHFTVNDETLKMIKKCEERLQAVGGKVANGGFSSPLHTKHPPSSSRPATPSRFSSSRPSSAQQKKSLGTVMLEINIFNQSIPSCPILIKIQPEQPSKNKYGRNFKNGGYGVYGAKNSTLKSSLITLSSEHNTPIETRMVYSTQSSFNSVFSEPSSASANQEKGLESDQSDCLKIGSRGHEKGTFSNIQGIAVHGDLIAVADSNAQKIQIFKTDGSLKLRFGGKGRTNGLMTRPTGVAFSGDGAQLLVSDYENKCVNIYDSNTGKFTNRIGHGKLVGPKGILVDKTDRIVVVDNKASVVWFFSAGGKVLGKFGKKGLISDASNKALDSLSPISDSSLKLSGPQFCCSDPNDGDVVLTDFHNHSVKVFDSQGKHKHTFGVPGNSPGQLSTPTGCCVDQEGRVLVANWGNSKIQIFSKTGEYIREVDTKGESLYGPQGLALTSDGKMVVVADSGNHCIKLFKNPLVD